MAYTITNQKSEFTRRSHNDFEKSNGELINCTYAFSTIFLLLPHDTNIGIVHITKGI